MTITEFIEKAIEGGFEDGRYLLGSVDLDRRTGRPKTAELMERTIFLKPEAWQAVVGLEPGLNTGIPLSETVEQRMVDFIRAIAQGKSIEEFLTNL